MFVFITHNNDDNDNDNNDNNSVRSFFDCSLNQNYNASAFTSLCNFEIVVLFEYLIRIAQWTKEDNYVWKIAQ